MMAMARQEARVVDGVELVLWPDSDSIKHYGVTDKQDVEEVDAKETDPHPVWERWR